MSDHKGLLHGVLREAYDLSGYASVMSITSLGRQLGNLSRVLHGDHDQRWAGML
jgi:hypothetical protein